MPRMFRRPTKATIHNLLAKLNRERRRQLIASGLLPAERPARFKWEWLSCPNERDDDGGILASVQQGVVYADTKSQAKALVKRELGITGRLPNYVSLRGEPNVVTGNANPT